MDRDRRGESVRPRRLLEVGVPPFATAGFFWVLQRLDLLADTPIWVLTALLVGALAVSEGVRAVAPGAYRIRTALMVVFSGAVMYATGWGPILIIGFMYGIAAPVRSFGSRAVPAAFVMSTVTIAAGQVAIALGMAPSLIEERLAHGLSVLGFLGLTFPSWVVYATAARKEASEAELRHQATHDPLTRLPNRTLFLDRLGATLVTRGPEEPTLAVLFVDLDRFKIVNDSLGHDVGDLLLNGVSHRITGCLRPGDVVARLGGDEFTVLIDRVTGVNDAVAVAERILDALELPFFLSGYEVVTSASIGIAVARGADADHLLRDADVAMYHAKRRGGGRHEVFTTQMGVQALARLELEGRLRRAIDDREFRLAYQPEVDIATGEVVGVEALVRWKSDPGAESLGDVITVAEETGLIVPLGRWVLDQACRDAQEWFAPLPAEVERIVAVNISARQFQQPDLVSQVSAVLGATGLDPRRTRLEITESAVMQDEDRGVALVHELKSLGVQIALDDFGTGHSSLSALSRLPADVLKLDRSFVARIEQYDIHAIVEAVVTMARRLRLRVVAEGVETEDQLSVLRSLGCEGCQGYLFSEAVPARQAEALVRDGRFPSGNPRSVDR